MTKKLEETFNLPPIQEEQEIKVTDNLVEPVADNIDELKHALDTVDKIDQALTPVKNLEALDKDMDSYAVDAMDAFQTLMDLGQNVEDRHAAPVFDSAAKMLKTALEAKDSKIDSKLKQIDLMIKKGRLDNNTNESSVTASGGQAVDRNELLKIINSDKNK